MPGCQARRCDVHNLPETHRQNTCELMADPGPDSKRTGQVAPTIDNTNNLDGFNGTLIGVRSHSSRHDRWENRAPRFARRRGVGRNLGV